MSDYAHLEDTRQPAEHDEDAEEPTMITGLRGNPDDHKYDALRYCVFGIDWEAEEW
jgi:hypothetical protein